MEIDISKVYGDLSYVAKYVGPLEFSGNLFAERTKDRIEVYDFVLLDVGNWAYSQIDPMLMLPLLTRPDNQKMKGWVHKHPIGNGIPGEHNWSGTDRNNILTTPLGSVPKLVQWSFSIVLTPNGWVGRIDNYVAGKTLHCPVTYFRSDIAAKAEILLPEKPKATWRSAEDIHPDAKYQEQYYGQPNAWGSYSHWSTENDQLDDEAFYRSNFENILQVYTSTDLEALQAKSDEDLMEEFDIFPYDDDCDAAFDVLTDVLADMGYPRRDPRQLEFSFDHIEIDEEFPWYDEYVD